jgi:hypothetical protein
MAAAEEGRFTIEPLLFHLAGIPSYLVLAELSVRRLLHGTLPVPGYPAALRRRAPEVWWGRAEATFGYTRSYHAPQGRLTQCAGLVAQAVSQAAHAILAARGEWITNEKTLLTRAGLREVDGIIAAARPDSAALGAAVDASRAACLVALKAAVSTTTGSDTE